MFDLNKTSDDDRDAGSAPLIPSAAPDLVPTAIPAGGSGLGSALLNALAVGLAGFAPTSSGFQGRVMGLAARNQERQRQMELMSGIGEAVVEVNGHVTSGNLDKANAAYRNLLRMPGAAGLPQVWGLGKDLQDRAYALQQKRGLAAILGQPRTKEVTIPGTPGTPGTHDITDEVHGPPAQQGPPLPTMVPGPPSLADAIRSQPRPNLEPAEGPQPVGPQPGQMVTTPGTPGTPATPDRTVTRDMRQEILRDLVASGQMTAEAADKLLYPAPQIVDGPFGSKWAYDHRAETMKVLTPGTLDLKPGDTKSLVDFGKLGATGQPAVMQVASGGLAIPSSLQDRALPSEMALYQRATQTGDYATANALTSKWQQAHFAAQVPDVQKSYLQRAGATQADMAAMASGDNSERIMALRDRATRISIADDEIKKADELATAKAISMANDPASRVFPSYKAYVDAKGQIIDGGALSGQQARDGMKAGALAGLDTDQYHRYQLLNNLTPQIAAMKGNIARLYAGVSPGTNLANAVALKTREWGGDGAVRFQESLNIDMAGELGRILMGSSRVPVAAFNRYLEHGTSNKTDTAESALVKAEFIANLQASSRANIANREPLKNVDPYETNPILRELDARRKQGLRPTISVDRQGHWTITNEKPMK